MSEIIPTKNINEKISIKVEKKIYSLLIIESAAIPLSDISTMSFRSIDDYIEVSFTLDDNSNFSSNDIKKSFLNNLAHESLREKIAQSTEIERNLILAYAFSNTKLMVE